MSRGAALLLTGVLFALPLQVRADEVDSWTYAYAGLSHFYNLEYQEAITYLEKAIEQEPDNPFFHSFLANTILFRQLLRTGQLEGNLYGASNSFLKTTKPKPDLEEIARFQQELARARELCRQRLAENRRDTDALYVLGVTYATEGNYKFTIEKSWFDALRAGGKANELHEKVLKLDPSYHDAKLVPGVYQYVVGSIPRSVKWLAFLFGFRGSRTKGVALL
ncbi:MAG: tetratricopeptide repeat protein, partial [Terriglobia bacterium]